MRGIAAAASEKRWLERAPIGPLDGVPLTVKDNILVRGLRATWGSKLYANYVPETDELPIARLRDAGAIILGKTNCPEFTLQGYTDNLLFGPTRNPWNLELTPGGSSGGAVAAVSAGIGPMAIGTDGGGSIRRPASHTGLVGLKPSRGRVPRCDGFPAILLHLETLGPMTRKVADLSPSCRSSVRRIGVTRLLPIFERKVLRSDRLNRFAFCLCPNLAIHPLTQPSGQASPPLQEHLRTWGILWRKAKLHLRSSPWRRHGA